MLYCCSFCKWANIQGNRITISRIINMSGLSSQSSLVYNFLEITRPIDWRRRGIEGSREQQLFLCSDYLYLYISRCISVSLEVTDTYSKVSSFKISWPKSRQNWIQIQEKYFLSCNKNNFINYMLWLINSLIFTVQWILHISDQNGCRAAAEMLSYYFWLDLRKWTNKTDMDFCWR